MTFPAHDRSSTEELLAAKDAEIAALRESVKALLELCAGTGWDEIVQAARAALEMSGGRSSET